MVPGLMLPSPLSATPFVGGDPFVLSAEDYLVTLVERPADLITPPGLVAVEALLDDVPIGMTYLDRAGLTEALSEAGPAGTAGSRDPAAGDRREDEACTPEVKAYRDAQATALARIDDVLMEHVAAALGPLLGTEADSTDAPCRDAAGPQWGDADDGDVMATPFLAARCRVGFSARVHAAGTLELALVAQPMQERGKLMMIGRFDNVRLPVEFAATREGVTRYANRRLRELLAGLASTTPVRSWPDLH